MIAKTIQIGLNKADFLFLSSKILQMASKMGPDHAQSLSGPKHFRFFLIWGGASQLALTVDALVMAELKHEIESKLNSR